MSLKGKRVIVTGGSKGLGLGVVKRLCEEGANLIIRGPHPHDLF